MKTRIIVGIALTLLFALMLYLGGWVLIAVCAIATVLAVHEMGNIMRQKGYRPWLLPAYVFAASYASLYYLLESVAVLFFLAFFCAFAQIAERMLSEKRSTEDLFAGLAVFLYPLPLFVVLMLAGVGFGREVGVTALLMAFAGPLVGDTLAFFIGSAFGKHKLCPQISPKKTVEGGVASVLGGVIGGALVMLLQHIWGSALPVAALLLLGAICGIVGQIGDLFASTIKRWAGVKDFGAIFPGHGGVMDRLDSVLLCAPVILAYFYYAAL